MNGEVFTGGATTSQHVDAQNDDHFENTTFKLKRTRSLGLLDEFILPLTDPAELDKQLEGVQDVEDAPSHGNNRETTQVDVDIPPNSEVTHENIPHGNVQSNESHESIDVPHGLSYSLEDYHSGSASSTGGSSASPQLGPRAESPHSERSASPLSIRSASPSKQTTVQSVNDFFSNEPQHVETVAEPHIPEEPESYKSPELIPHDDSDLTTEPLQHVDYLSYQWDVSDISKSWRYVISKRKDVANSARLENASWRTWAQRRGNLKTISPEVVNWSKESDVTWLYGPILKDEENHIGKDNSPPRTTVASSAVAGDISISKPACNAPKPILKRRTVQDTMISHSNLLKLQLATNKLHQQHREKLAREKLEREEALKHKTDRPDFYDYDLISAKLNAQYKNIPTEQLSLSQSNSLVNLQNLVKRNSSNSLARANSSSSLARGSQRPNFTMNEQDEDDEDDEEDNDEEKGIDLPVLINEPVHEIKEPQPLLSKKDRHIRFNDTVSQCISVDTYSDDEYLGEYEYESDEEQDYPAFSSEYAESYENSDYNADIEDDDEDEDDEGGFFLNVKSASSAIPALSSKLSKEPDATDDTESISTNNSKVYRTIKLLEPTSINFGSLDESSDDDNPYTSSVSHGRGNSTRGFDYHYDYNTVYTVDPKHAIYGKLVPDVCDVPENIAVGSNIEYDGVAGEMPIIFDSVGNVGAAVDGHHSDRSDRNDNQDMKVPAPKEKVPDSRSGTQTEVTRPFDNGVPSRSAFDFDNDSGSDSDSDNGLSIGARSSSQALAQQVFGLTDYPENYPQPVDKPVSSINPRFSSTSLSKQPSSSNSLSGSFFGDNALTKKNLSLSQLFLGTKQLDLTLGRQDSDGKDQIHEQHDLPEQDDTPNLTKQKKSSGALSLVFLGGEPRKSSRALSQVFLGGGEPRKSSTALSDLFFGGPPAAPPSPPQRSLSNTQSKSSPLPPHTTSTNAFPLQRVALAKTFLFDSDSDSDEEPMSIGGGRNFSGNTSSNLPGTNSAGTSSVATPSYTSLSQVAGKSGIKSPSPEKSGENLVGQAKGLANHFLGSWKNNSEDHE